MQDLIYLAAQLAIAAICFLLGKYVLPSIPKDTFAVISRWAYVFVRDARQFLSAQTGEERMEFVLDRLAEVAEEQHIDITFEQLRAIAQSAYDAMKAGIEDGASK